MKTRVVNLYGGPGTGKSTTAARVFSDLKRQGVEAELVTEVAKNFVWEERPLSDQAYIMVKQMHAVQRCLDKVEVVVTDAPILFALIYGRHMFPSYKEFIRDVHNSWNTLDVFIKRSAAKKYSENGRTQSYGEALALDSEIKRMLLQECVEFLEVLGPPNDCHEDIVQAVLFP